MALSVSSPLEAASSCPASPSTVAALPSSCEAVVAVLPSDTADARLVTVTSRSGVFEAKWESWSTQKVTNSSSRSKAKEAGGEPSQQATGTPARPHGG